MRQVYLNQEKSEEVFALEAAEHFSKHPEHRSYTSSEIEAGCLFALRFGLGRDCVVVLKLDEDHEPVNYCQIIKVDE